MELGHCHALTIPQMYVLDVPQESPSIENICLVSRCQLSGEFDPPVATRKLRVGRTWGSPSLRSWTSLFPCTRLSIVHISDAMTVGEFYVLSLSPRFHALDEFSVTSISFEDGGLNFERKTVTEGLSNSR